MNEIQQKALAADTFGLGQSEAQPKRINRVLQIDSLVGGFVVTRHSDYSRPEREVVPNTDCLVSLVQKWASEGEAEGQGGQ